MAEYKEPNLMNYLPWYYQESAEMLRLQTVLADNLKSLRFHSIPELLDQSFISRATWGLQQWEYELGIVNTDNIVSWRRETLLAKLRGMGTSTKWRIKNVAETFSGGEVEVTEYNKDHRFEIKFVGILGIPDNMAGFLNVLDEIKPAHLGYTIKYSYTVWNMLLPLTWSEAGTRTWGQLRVYGG